MTPGALRPRSSVGGTTWLCTSWTSPTRPPSPAPRRRYGALDVLVNNAAIAFKGSDPTPFAAQAAPTIETNFHGTVACTAAFLPLLLKSADQPRIVNIASQAGHLDILPSRERRQAFESASLTLPQLEGFMREFVADVQNGQHSKVCEMFCCGGEYTMNLNALTRRPLVQRGWPNTCYGTSKLAVVAYTRILVRQTDRHRCLNLTFHLTPRCPLLLCGSGPGAPGRARQRLLPRLLRHGHVLPPRHQNSRARGADPPLPGDAAAGRRWHGRLLGRREEGQVVRGHPHGRLCFFTYLVIYLLLSSYENHVTSNTTYTTHTHPIPSSSLTRPSPRNGAAYRRYSRHVAPPARGKTIRQTRRGNTTAAAAGTRPAR